MKIDTTIEIDADTLWDALNDSKNKKEYETLKQYFYDINAETYLQWLKNDGVI